MLYNGGMRIGLFGGSFDPVHCEHIALAAAAKQRLALDKVIFIPAGSAPHKPSSCASARDRLAMCRIACRDLPFAAVSGFETERGGKSYSYLTCRHFRSLYPDAEIFFLMGADMLDNFFSWRNPQEIVSLVKIAACGRAEKLDGGYHVRFRDAFGCDFEEIPFTGADVSSTDLRVALAFSAIAPKELDGIGGEVRSYIGQRGLYAYPDAERGLLLEHPSRREHSYRVARLACRRAKGLQIPEEKALLAAMLHDCGKHVPLSSPLLAGFTPPEQVPVPVLHQYTGAFLAETYCGVTDPDVLSAVRFHTSGRADMTALGKLIYLADLLEEDRSFEGIETLRALFWRDLDLCLKTALEAQIAYLERAEKPVFFLTRQALEFLSKS